MPQLFDGDESAQYLDWSYVPDVVPNPHEVFDQLSRELGFDPITGIPLEAATLFQPVEARQVRFFGKVHPLPFRQVFFGAVANHKEPKLHKTNPSLLEREELQPVHALGSSPCLTQLRARVAEKLGVPPDFLNYCNLNLYAAGDKSKLGAHADRDHQDALSDVVAASITLMRTPTAPRRKYVLRDATKKAVLKVALKNGSLTTLGRHVNRSHTHEMPAQRRAEARLSVNFRRIPPPASC